MALWVTHPLQCSITICTLRWPDFDRACTAAQNVITCLNALPPVTKWINFSQNQFTLHKAKLNSWGTTLNLPFLPEWPLGPEKSSKGCRVQSHHGAGRAAGISQCWLMSLLPVSWIFHDVGTEEVVLHSGHLTCERTPSWKKKKKLPPNFPEPQHEAWSVKSAINKHLKHVTHNYVWCHVWLRAVSVRLIESDKQNELLYLRQLIASFVSRWIFHLLLPGAGY